MNLIEIWHPRYHDRKILIAKHKVGNLNKIVITKSSAYKGAYKMTGQVIKGYPIENNGKIECYAVPVGELEPIDA